MSREHALIMSCSAFTAHYSAGERHGFNQR
jgi:hypothetical protein